MKKFIVIDKVQGFSWINDNTEEVFLATQCNTFDEMKDIYEVIEIEGNFDLSYLID